MTRASDTARLIGAGATIKDGTTIITDDNTAQLTLRSTDADASTGPLLVLNRDSASPADDDVIGVLQFKGNDDAGNSRSYVQVQNKINDASNGTLDGEMQIYTLVGDNSRSRIELLPTETVFNQDNIDLDFRVEAVGFNNALLVRGSDGVVLVGKSNTNSSVQGIFLSNSGNHMSRSDGNVVLINRQDSDGQLMGFANADSTEGNISVSGGTVSFNAFSGSHWSRLADNSKPTILKGTVIETIDEMCDWYQVTFTVPATDDTPEHSPKISITLEDGQSVGDTITYNHDGTDYQATIIQEDDNKHTKCKISDTADSKRVYGVFADWDNDDDTVNDMYVTAVGTHVVRVHSSATVSAGDLLVSNGDGTAKVQDDDIIRSKTIGKVLTNIKQETYSDGSYTVPCALYCG